MRKSNYFIAAFILVVTNVFIGRIESQNPRLTIPPSYEPIGGLPTSLTTFAGGYTGFSAQSCHNSMIDVSNNIKFFIVDENVYKSNGDLMVDDFTNLPTGMYTPNGSPQASGNSEICIVPDPANCTKYYIFSASTDPLLGPDHWFPTYSHVDVANGSLEHFAPFTTAVDLRTLMVGLLPSDQWGQGGDFIGSFGDADATRPTFAATKPLSNGSYMVFIYDGIKHIYRFMVTNTGVSFLGLTLTLNYPLVGWNFTGQYQRAELEIIEKPPGNAGYRIAGAAFLHDDNSVKDIVPLPTVFTAELASSGLLVPGTDKYFFYQPFIINATSFAGTHIHGLEFSPNSKFLYVSHFREDVYSTAPNPIEYFDCTTPTFLPAILPAINSDTTEPFEYSQLEYGLDGKIYATDGVTLATINDPDNPATTTFTPNAVTIPGGYNYTDEFSASEYLRTYTLPDQIDGLNYANQFAGINCCIASSFYDVNATYTYVTNDFEVPTNNNLNGGTGANVYIHHDIVIPAGKIVTFQGMNLIFSPGAKMLVQRGNNVVAGGMVTLDNCTLTVDNRCDTTAMWNGVEVEGYSTSLQTPLATTLQGQLKVISNTIIKHAYIGVAAAKFTTFDPLTHTFIHDPTFGGGIIRMSLSTIENCAIDLWFADYGSGVANISQITLCNLQTTHTLKNPAYTPGTHAFIVNNDGITFRGNNIQNTAPNSFAQNTRGYGIYAINAKVNIIQQIFPNVGNTFRNLWYGIIGFPTLGLKPITSRNSFFDNCYHGIILSASHFSTITSNNFNIPLDPNLYAADKPYGLLMTGCTGYKVEANNFHSLPALSNNYGLIVDNSGVLNNQIYRNTFQNLLIGGQSQGINGSITSSSGTNAGLRWKCNTFNQMIYRADLVFASGRIAQMQGSCPTNPAANIFSEYNPIFYPDHDFAANTPPVILTTPVYYSQWITGTPQYFNNYNPSIFIPITGCGSGGISCPSTLGPFGLQQIPLLKIDMQLATNTISNLSTQIDGGNKQTLLNAINTYSNGTLKNLLMSKSPYLSDDVLSAYINKSSIPAGHMKEVVIANSPVTEDVYDLIVAKNLPNGIMNQINAAQTGVSGMQKLLGEMDLYHAQRNEDMNQIIRIYLNDTIIVNPIDSVITILEQEITTYHDLKGILALAAMEKGDHTKANTLKNEIAATEGYTNFCKYIDAAISIGTVCNVKNAVNNNPGLRAQIEDIAYDGNDLKNAMYGKNIMNLAFDTLFPGIIEVLLPYERSMATNPITVSEDNGVDMFVYPNPATNSINIQLPDNTDTENMIAYLYNSLGQSVAYRQLEGNLTAVFDVQHLANGIYLITVLDNGNLISVQKVVINR